MDRVVEGHEALLFQALMGLGSEGGKRPLGSEAAGRRSRPRPCPVPLPHVSGGPHPDLSQKRRGPPPAPCRPCLGQHDPDLRPLRPAGRPRGDREGKELTRLPEASGLSRRLRENDGRLFHTITPQSPLADHGWTGNGPRTREDSEPKRTDSIKVGAAAIRSVGPVSSYV